MCGRYYLKTPPAQLKIQFGLTDVPGPVHEGMNISPTQEVPVVINSLPYTLLSARWGLIPSWAKDPKVGNRMFNARAEGIQEKPAFRTAVQRRRCLVLADGFYEWRKNPNGTKTPLRYALKSGQPLAFAGLWELWRPPGLEAVRSCTIITTAANDLVGEAHDRMPVILPPGREREWLGQGDEAAAAAVDLLKPLPADLMTAAEADPDLLRPAAKAPPQAKLPLDSQRV